MTLPAPLAGGGQLAGDLQRGHQRRPARAAGEDPLLARQAAGHRERVAIADPDPAIDDGRVVRAREEVLADALREIRPGGVTRQHGPLRIRADDHHVAGSARAGNGRPRRSSRPSRRSRRNG